MLCFCFFFKKNFIHKRNKAEYNTKKKTTRILGRRQTPPHQLQEKTIPTEIPTQCRTSLGQNGSSLVKSSRNKEKLKEEKTMILTMDVQIDRINDSILLSIYTIDYFLGVKMKHNLRETIMRCLL